MFAAFLLVSLLRLHATTAAPAIIHAVGPQDDEVFDRYHHVEPRSACTGRSVQDILWSCLATTFAVTWVSVHPNVPFLEENKWTVLRRRIFLMLLALLAPEVMIMWAFKQWRGAVIVRDVINRARSQADHPWTMQHAHFLQMGGIKLICTKAEAYEGNSWFRSHWKALNRDYAYQSQYDGMWIGVLSFHKFKDLLSTAKIRFPNHITKEEIMDRSKGDALSKGVALIQITWFIIQLLGRVREGLAITEIQLTTAALAGLNSIMYLFWWNKPLDISCPIVLGTEGAERVLAEEGRRVGKGVRWDFPTREDDQGYIVPDESFRFKHYVLVELKSGLRMIQETACDSYMELKHTACTLISRTYSSSRASSSISREALSDLDGEDEDDEKNASPSKTEGDGIVDIEHCLPSHRLEYVPPDCVQSPSIHRKPQSVHFQDQHRAQTVRVFHAALHRIRDSILLKPLYLPYFLMFLPLDKILDPGIRIRDFKSRDRSNLHQQDFYNDAKHKIHHKHSFSLLFDEEDMKWIMSMMFYSEFGATDTKPLLYFAACAGAAFGSIHCAAWYFVFPSPTEQTMWRTASIALVGSCLCVLCGSLIREMTLILFFRTADSSKAKPFWDTIDEYILKFIRLKAVHVIISVVYPTARLLLLILALTSLHDLPASALDSLTLTSLIPHI